MRRRRGSAAVRLMAAVVISLLFGGCVVQSVSPFYEKERLVEMPSLQGKWVLRKSRVDEGLNREWNFTATAIELPAGKSGAATLSARFFRIDDQLFLDTVADAPSEGQNTWWLLHVSPVHTVSRVVAEERSMKIIPLDSSWMEKALKNKTVTLSSVWNQEQNSHLVTASPQDWTAFLKEYGKDGSAFPEQEALVFVREQGGKTYSGQ